MTRPRRTSRHLLAVGIAVVLLAGAACSSSSPAGSSGTTPVGTDQVAPGDAQSTDSGGSAAAVPSKGSAGCGKPVEDGLHGAEGKDDDVERTITVDGVERTYRLGVPRDSDNKSPQPLILNSHGSGSNALQQSVYSQLPLRAGKAGYVVVTPEAIDGKWELFATDAKTGPDLQFFKDLLADIEGRFCIDLNRVFASGISLGAAVSADLGCTLTDQIAAVGLVAVEVPFEPCDRRLPVIAFHGTADRTVPYKAGDLPPDQPNAALPGTQTNMATWAEIDGCDPTPTTEDIKTEIVHATWSGCKDGSAVELYTVNGGGHSWPGSPIKVDYLGHTTDEIDATALILAFFEAHPFRAS